MKFFQKKHSICAECGVHFEPVTGYEARWGQFCAAHRKKHRENDEKKDAVLRWAARNWIRLHDQMIAEFQTELAKPVALQTQTQDQAMSQTIRNAQQGVYQHFGFGGFL